MFSQLGPEGGNPEMLPAPIQAGKPHLLVFNKKEGLHQWDSIRPPNLDQPLVLHGQIGKILNSGSLLVDLREGNHFVSGWQVAIHKYTS